MYNKIKEHYVWVCFMFLSWATSTQKEEEKKKYGKDGKIIWVSDGKVGKVGKVWSIFVVNNHKKHIFCYAIKNLRF